MDWPELSIAFRVHVGARPKQLLDYPKAAAHGGQVQGRSIVVGSGLDVRPLLLKYEPYHLIMALVAGPMQRRHATLALGFRRGLVLDEKFGDGFETRLGGQAQWRHFDLVLRLDIRFCFQKHFDDIKPARRASTMQRRSHP